MKIFDLLKYIVGKFAAPETRWSVFLASFLGVISLRVLEESFLASAGKSFEGVVINFLYNFFFFALLFLAIWLFLAFFLKENPKNIAGIILWGFWLIILPPIFDIWKTGGSVFWSFYALNGLDELWGQFITLFGRMPSGIVYFGTKIVFVLTLLLVGVFIFFRTKSRFKAVVGALMAYLIIFIMGSFPSWLVFIYYFFEGSKSVGEIGSVDIVQFFAFPHLIFGANGYDFKYAFTSNLNLAYFSLILIFSGGLFFLSGREKFWAVMKNLRFPQLIYHTGLFLVGMGLGYWAYPQNLEINLFSIVSVIILLASVFLAWEASVVFNDLYDARIDNITNGNRPLPRKIFASKDYADLGIIFFFLSLIGGLVVSVKFSLLFLVYQVLASVYSLPPYRLKRFPVVATFFSSLASVLIVMIGFSLFSGNGNLNLFPWRIFLLLVVSLTLSLPIKDFKDIEGDRKDGVWTIPAIFGEYHARTIVASGIFLSFMLSVLILNENDLFWPALTAGAAAFWTMTNRKVKTRQMNWWVMGILFLYIATALAVLFF